MILGHQSGILFEAQAQNGADEYSNGALAWISAGALPSIGGAQVRINGAFGLEYSNECCSNKMKAYFIKMDELKEKFHDALIRENSGRLLDGLSKYSCLIIDEVGYCKFNREETLLFFQLVDRVSLKKTGSIVLTSNKDLSQWVGLFDEDDALECTIDRLWDKAICMTFSGISHRGTNREQIELNFMKLR